MKILDVNIVGFGATRDLERSFSDGLNPIISPNGSGKSTFAAFLCAMFYGLPASRAGGLFNDREHFLPFSGGKFGGTITFEQEGHTFRIERFFDKKSTTRDSLLVRRDGRETDELGDCPGQTIFGLDAESFRQTLFFDGTSLDRFSTPELRARLGNGSDDTGETTTVEKAVAILKDAGKQLSAKDKGSISQRRAEIRRLKDEIEDAEQTRRNLQTLYGEYNAVRARLAQIRPSIDAALTVRLRNEQWKRADELAEELDAVRREVNRLSERYPLGFPSEEQIASLRNDAAFLHSSAADADDERIKHLNARFPDGVPSEETFTQISALLTRRALLEEKIASCEELLAQPLSLRFPTPPDGKTVRSVTAGLAAMNERAGQSAQKTAGAKRRFFLPLLVCAAASMIGGGALCAFSIPIGIALLGVGFLLGVLAFASGKKSVAPEPSDDAVLASLLRPYGYDLSLGIPLAAQSFLKDVEDDEAKRADADALAKSAAEMKQQLDNLYSECLRFFERYGETRTDAGTLRLLEADAAELSRLYARQSEKRDKIERAKERIRTISQAYRLSPSEDPVAWCAALEADRNEYLRLTRQSTEQENALSRFKAENRLSEPRPASGENPDDLIAEEEVANKNLARLEARIREGESILEFLGEKESALEIAEEKLAADEKNSALFTAAIRFLLSAQDAVNERLVEPLKTAFVGYAASVERLFGEKIGMKPDLNIFFEAGGELRSEKHWSAGQRTICNFCFRLALADALFGDASVPIFLDDPFTALDEEHFRKIAVLVRRIAEDRQVIYFTCHPSRSLS